MFPCSAVSAHLHRPGSERLWRDVHDLHLTDGKQRFVCFLRSLLYELLSPASFSLCSPHHVCQDISGSVEKGPGSRANYSLCHQVLQAAVGLSPAFWFLSCTLGRQQPGEQRKALAILCSPFLGQLSPQSPTEQTEKRPPSAEPASLMAWGGHVLSPSRLPHAGHTQPAGHGLQCLLGMVSPTPPRALGCHKMCCLL